ncbi:putative GNAT superfamily acetyltransferase [Nakamurella sp. UYEF19]|uniref:GNAT family N-acetyltransferase n=1 Tax=Nakamurella sp. UYEF19 TaxID=1756392 RepID=UPI00339628D8
MAGPGTEQRVDGAAAIVAEARQAAAAVAAASGVVMRELTSIQEFEDINLLLSTIWGSPPSRPHLSAELLRALSHAGNYVVGAYDGSALVGAGIGFCGPPATHTLHSHIVGVATSAQRRNVGFSLKLHQRNWALERDLTTIAWTFDPLIRRNAHFNLAKLAGSAVAYLPDFYGQMRDGINLGQDSDRILVHWDLLAPTVAEACRGRGISSKALALLQVGADFSLAISLDGEPEPVAPLTPTVLIVVPQDIEELRLRHPEMGARWRTMLRRALVDAFESGARIVGFDRRGWYVLQGAPLR